MEVIGNGSNIWISSPSFNIYSRAMTTHALSETIREAGRWINTDLDATPYRLIARSTSDVMLARKARGIHFLGSEPLEDQTACLLRGHRPLPGFGRAADKHSHLLSKTTPVTVWVERPAAWIRQMNFDFTGIITSTQMPAVSGSPPARVSLKQYVLSTKHSRIRTNESIPAETFQFLLTSEPPQLDEIDPDALMVRPLTPGDGPPAKADPARSATLIPARATGTPAELLDLDRYDNAALTENWQSNLRSNNLAHLPRGRQRFGEIEFDVRGVIQLAGTAAGYLQHTYANDISGILIRKRLKRLHLVHGTGWSSQGGTQIAQYLIHYADARQRAIPIRYGFDVCNGWPQSGEPSEAATGSIVAWRGRNRAIGDVRLYRSPWINPRPDLEITSISFTSSLLQRTIPYRHQRRALLPGKSLIVTSACFESSFLPESSSVANLLEQQCQRLPPTSIRSTPGIRLARVVIFPSVPQANGQKTQFRNSGAQLTVSGG